MLSEAMAQIEIEAWLKNEVEFFNRNKEFDWCG